MSGVDSINYKLLIIELMLIIFEESNSILTKKQKTIILVYISTCTVLAVMIEFFD